MEQALYTRLSTYAGLVALVSTRIYPLVAPQNATKPYITYSRISTQREYSYSGYSNLQRVRFQISCYAETYAAAKAIAIQVMAAVEAWTAVQAAFVENQTDLFEKETKLYHVPVDIFVWNS
jgi:hypothetical protein